MVSTAAFSRTGARLARHDVSPHMVKWWKNVTGDNGLVTKHLSPYEQQAIVPWLRTWPQKAYEKFIESGAYWVSAGAIVIGTAKWGDGVQASQDFAHRF